MPAARIGQAQPARPLPGQRPAATAAAPAPPPPSPPTLLTWADVRADAADAGLDLRLSGVGPFFKLECRRAGAGASSPSLAVLSGALAPPWLAPWAGGIAHIDALEVRNRELRRAEARAVLVSLGPAGVGGLLARAAFTHAFEAAGCRTAEALAILDDEATHRRLVGAYKRVAGFKEVKECEERRRGDGGRLKKGKSARVSSVPALFSLSLPQVAFVSGSALADVPHMLVWGGAGTRLDSDIPGQLAKWGAARARRRGERVAAGAAAGVGFRSER